MYLHILIRRYALIILAYCAITGYAVDCQPTNSGINSSCYCQEVNELQTPWTDGTLGTAPSARNVSLSFFHRDGILLPRISWTVSTQYLRYIDGFYIEVILLHSEYQYFSCSFNSNHTKQLWQRSRVTFHFEHCCHQLYDGLHAGDDVYALINSLPLYSAGDYPYHVFDETTVPEEQEAPSSVDEQSYYEPTTGTTNVTRTTKASATKKGMLTDDNVLLAALISLAAVLLVIAVLTILLCLRRKWKEPQKGYVSTSQSKRILFISSDEVQYITLYNGLIESIKKCCAGEVDIVANIRRQNETASCSIIPWITKNMRDSDVVVIVISKPSQLDNKLTEAKSSNNERSTVTVALNVAQSEAVQSNFVNMKRKFITLHIGSYFQQADLIPYCTHYAIPKHLREAMKQILGAHYNASFKIDDVGDSLLRQLSGIRDSSNDDSHDTENNPTSQSNDLNRSLIDSSTVELNDLDKSVLYYSSNKTDNNLSMV